MNIDKLERSTRCDVCGCELKFVPMGSINRLSCDNNDCSNVFVIHVHENMNETDILREVEKHEGFSVDK